MQKLQSIASFESMNRNELSRIMGGEDTTPNQSIETAADSKVIGCNEDTHQGVKKSWTSDCTDDTGTEHYGITYAAVSC
jgi:hypothetical protein